MNDFSSPPNALAQLRAQLDTIDDQIHALLMARAAVVESVARDGGKTGTKIRPGREAAILRRLLACHQGAWPAQAIVRIWREIFGAALIIEGGQTMAVCDGEGGAERLALAREHFGPLTPVRRHHNPAQTLADLARDAAQLAILPPPAEDDDGQGGWWQMLTASAPHRLFVIAKIPFWTKRAEGLPLGEAFVVAAVRPDPSGQDRSLLVLELSASTSRARVASLLKGSGFTPSQIWVKRIPGGTSILALVEVEDFIEDTDPRLSAIAGLNAPPVVIGAFAVPLGDTP
ncbi:chorismate mutase [Acidocella sp.]|uniref:chorismate mutase n=1 Tax=Acidocella sp. TaxID=50710 RepID=UPI002607DD55|nr:chorismate mutase [Acidocella sp.]MDD2794945.1 chorismate mutase [Acidocella sp.]